MSQFSDTTTKDGLIQDCEQRLFGDDGYGQISGNANRLYRFTQLLNEGLKQATGIILGADTTWQFDDTNFTDYPIATTNLVSGQRDYTLAVTHLKILKVQILTAATSGIWQEIFPFDMQAQNALPYLENNTGNVGIPWRYDVHSTGLWLDPVPMYSATAGIRIYFQRPPSLFVYTDTEKQPGFPSIFHKYVSIYASLQYAKDRILKDKVATLTNDLIDAEARIVSFYSERNKDGQPKIVPHREPSN